MGGQGWLSEGELGDIALKEYIVTIEWNELPDLSKLKSKADLERLYWETYPDAKKMRAFCC